jgi:hypothetical protein
MKILFCIILLLFVFSLAFPLVFAEEKNVDVSVVVVNNSLSDPQNSYTGSGDNRDSNNLVNSGGGNNGVSNIQSSIDENGISQSFNNGVSEMFSFKSQNPWTLPLIFLVIIIIIVIIIYEIIYHTRKKRKTRGMRRRVYHRR